MIEGIRNGDALCNAEETRAVRDTSEEFFVTRLGNKKPTLADQYRHHISSNMERYSSGVIPRVRKLEEIRLFVKVPRAGTTTGRVSPVLLKIL